MGMRLIYLCDNFWYFCRCQARAPSLNTSYSTKDSNLPVSIDDQASYPSIPNAFVNVIRSFRFRMYPVDIAIFNSTKLLFFSNFPQTKIDEFSKFCQKLKIFSSSYMKYYECCYCCFYEGQSLPTKSLFDNLNDLRCLVLPPPSQNCNFCHGL